MTLLIPSCAEVTALLTDYEEGALGPFAWLGLRLHLGLCPPCQTFLKNLKRAPALLRQAWDEAPTPQAEQALCGALTLLREGRAPMGPQHHPEPEAWVALGPGGDPLLALLLRVHLGHCASCREQHGAEQAIPPEANSLEGLRPHLPADTRWSWSRWGLGGSRVARLAEDTQTGAVLSLARMPGGNRIPRHGHVGPEVSVLLCGSLQDGPAHLHAGDWIRHQPGSIHAPEADGGPECLAIVHLEGGLRFEGWRSLLGTVR
jgi:putative transcriptional regulator